ncbi:hypothetical protein RCOM_0938600 [Ricinus communis]|uniref:Uncharacterized protein n=1 Tax=Ricinus communis TaxID=3988 RepID=B9RZE1_RICCO|nr:hypothetical protein RCOM_0938600 [Ricinus communis]
MGICNSCSPITVASSAKLTLEDGRLEEFPYPVRLELGHLYFELPLGWLHSPIKAQEIAALAVKASLALKIDDHGRYRCCWWYGFKRADVMWLSFEKGVESRPLVTIVGCSNGSDGGGGGGIVGRGKNRVDRGDGGERKFTNNLSVILEGQGDR